LGSAGVILAPKQLASVIGVLLKNIKEKDKAKSFPYIEALGSIASTVGYKLAPNLNSIIPVLSIFLKPKDPAEQITDDMDNGIKEVCLSFYDISLRKCPKEASEHINEILNTSLGMIGYDPNRNPDAAKTGVEEAGMEAWGEPAEIEQRIEDDSSWKVRKAAANILATIVRYRSDVIKQMYKGIVDVLLSRLDEREESIKCIILNTFTEMIKGIVIGEATDSEDSIEILNLKRKSSAEILIKELPIAVVKVYGHFKDKSNTVREAIANLLFSLAIAVPDYMNGTLLSETLPNILDNYKDSSTTIKQILLQTLRRLIRTAMTPDGYVDFLGKIIEVLTIAMKDEYYKLPAESLKTAGALVHLLKKDGMQIEGAAAAIKSILEMANSKFKLADIDQEIKQAAIYDMGMLIAYAPEAFSPKDINDAFAALQDRLKSEALRYAIMKAFYHIVTSPFKLDIDKALEICLRDIMSMTHKILRPVKLAGLDCLLAVVEKYPNSWKNSASDIVQDMGQNLRESDLVVIRNTLKILKVVIGLANDASLANLISILFDLCKNPLVVPVQDEVIQIFAIIGKRGKGELQPNTICSNLKNCVNEKTSRTVAGIIASLLLLNASVLPKEIEKYIKILADEKETVPNRKLAAIVIGNVGQITDFSSYSSLNQLLKDLLKHSDEDIKMNAAICIGNIACGNKKHFIPFIMDQLKTQSELSYRMLVAVREIVVQNCEGIMEYFKDILPVLRSQADTDNESDRNIVAEIIGKLLLAKEAAMVPEIEANLKNPKPNIRATYALAFKHWYFKGKQDLTQFNVSLLNLLALLEDKNPKVSKALLDSFTHIAHSNAMNIRNHCIPLFKGILPLTIVNKDLIKWVDLGPLKHKTDEGEPLRKGAYTLIQQMLPSLYDRMNLPMIMDHVVVSLGDDSDEVQSIAQQILIKICDISPGVVLGPLEKIIEQVTKEVKRLQEKIKKQQDVDRSSDNIRGFLRVLIALNKLPEIDLNQKYQENLTGLLKEAVVKAIYEELCKLSK
jgi:cullin-associated NEDD8-dissociated protein 1